MEQQYLVWRCNFGCGGLGDRIVGLVTCSVIAEIIGRRFLIDWKNPGVDSVMEINPKYNYQLLNDTRSQSEERWIDRHRTSFIQRFIHSRLEDEWINQPIVCVTNNQPYHLLLWKNKHYLDTLEDRVVTTRRHYHRVLNEYFTVRIKTNPIPFLNSSVAVHMRFGDWTYNSNLSRTPEQLYACQYHHARDYALLFKLFLDQHLTNHPKPIRLLLFSDADTTIVHSAFRSVFSHELDQPIITTSSSQQGHLDLLTQPNPDLSSILLDLVSIGQCRHIVFWDNTNFARVAILTSSRDDDMNNLQDRHIWMFRSKCSTFERIEDYLTLMTKDPSIL